MICKNCGLMSPDDLPHTNMDLCLIAITAAQDAVQTVIKQQLAKLEQKGGDNHGHSHDTL